MDNVHGGVALDVEWNAKDGNLDRDLAAYRSLYDVGIISAGVMIDHAGARRDARDGGEAWPAGRLAHDHHDEPGEADPAPVPWRRTGLPVAGHRHTSRTM